MEWLSILGWPALTGYVATSSVGFIIAVRFLLKYGSHPVMLGQAVLWPLGLTLLLLHYSGHT